MDVQKVPKRGISAVGLPRNGIVHHYLGEAQRQQGPTCRPRIWHFLLHHGRGPTLSKYGQKSPVVVASCGSASSEEAVDLPKVSTVHFNGFANSGLTIYI
jgi:hypothetical protein